LPHDDADADPRQVEPAARAQRAGFLQPFDIGRRKTTMSGVAPAASFSRMAPGGATVKTTCCPVC
jgi:hypothetical protein